MPLARIHGLYRLWSWQRLFPALGRGYVDRCGGLGRGCVCDGAYAPRPDEAARARPRVQEALMRPLRQQKAALRGARAAGSRSPASLLP